ncbi:receptor-type tyrosine-protein phosphatase delta [Halictus rubicundus]|uniref:receptor-type tyrosine-protein phosphatase delta n=1 Tax=Halictus rubicundus TaxID=77578 RepID=UPI004036707D
MSVAEVLILAVQFAVVSGKLAVLRGKEDTYYKNRILICVSDDDGAGLTWNSNLNWFYSSYQFTDRRDVTAFKNPDEPRQRSQLDCELGWFNNCASSWSTEGWNRTNSSETPMGPVLDRRWEEFEEHFIKTDEYQFIHTMQSMSPLVVSIRGTTDAYILICWGDRCTTNSSYWIVIGGWNNTNRSVIRKCVNGVPKPNEYPIEDSCQQERDNITHAPLSPFEWKTFVVTWNESTGNISVYDSERMILTFVESEKLLSRQNANYNLFVRSRKPALFRFHLYDFLHTTNQDAVLASPELSVTTTNFCVEMAVGLCAECQLELTLANPSSGSVEQTLALIKGSPTVHGLPAWQYVRVEKTLSSGNSRVTLRMVTILKQETPNPLWAVANVRSCPWPGSTRKGKMTATVDYHDSRYYWPNVTCQKLFYNENTVVTSLPVATLNMEFADSDCPSDKVGPYCSVSCTKDLQLQADCRSAAICEEPGCTCPSGFTGPRCDTICAPKQYGHDCKRTCGFCLDNECNSRTGECMFGCDLSRGYKLPPLCKIGIDPLPPPTIDFINETSIYVSLPKKEEYQLVFPTYVCEILKEGEQSERNFEDVTVSGNDTKLFAYSVSLQPGVSYSIRCSLKTNNLYHIEGEWTNFMTRCNPSTNFEVKQKNTSLILKRNSVSQDSTSCPVKWYNFIIEDRDTGRQTHNGPLSSLPYEFENLTPYTIYKIMITREGKDYFSREVRTLEAAPSKVRNIKSKTTSSTVKLSWNRPSRENGIVKKYQVVLKTIEYFGCTDYGLSSPQKELRTSTTLTTTIEFSQLAPYAKYTAKISACNSFCSEDKGITFSTDQAVIPSETFSNVRLEGFVLAWSPPEDCSTITGSLLAKIIITGVSEAVKNFNVTKRTSIETLNVRNILHGAEDYVARIYAIRSWKSPYDESVVRRFPFRSPPKEPPPVRNLEAYEFNAKNGIMQLRWQEPKPPLNGEILRYHVQGNAYNQLWTVLPGDYCSLWTEYICAIIKITYPLFSVPSRTEIIKVLVENKNVSTYSIPSSVPVLREAFPPSQPEVFRLQAFPEGVVGVTWSHPWKTGGRLRRFNLIISTKSTNLREGAQLGPARREYPVENYQREYKDRLYLMPSTTYNISIVAETVEGLFSEEKFDRVHTPLAIAFEKDLTLEVRNESSMILLHIPVVLNDTRHSVMHVIVKGSQPCSHYTKASRVLTEEAGIDYYDTAWRAATLPTNEIAGKPFMVGDNKLYDGVVNCPLKPQESYVIAVVLVTGEDLQNSKVVLAKSLSVHMGEVPKRPIAFWLIPIIVALILAAVAFYLYRRKRMKPLADEVPQEEVVLAVNLPNQEDRESLNSNRILTSTPIASRKECLSRVDTLPDDSLLLAGYDDANQKENNSSLVKVKDFEDYVKQAIESGLLDKQYNTMPRGQTKPWDYGKLPQNKPKNRYANLIAYDENRVILEKLPDDPHSDYINANYIKGYKKEKCYIATQGPKPATVNDFWRMVWQEESLIICMLANVIENGKIKCEQYWPDIGKKKKYGDLVVFNAKHTVYADYTFRTLHLTSGEETRKIEHLHYTAWPDHGVPLSTHSVVTYLKKLLATSPGNGPAVVHCSAGVGRTGTIILCDICLRRAAAEGMVDVFAETASIRSQRANMVDTKQQYLLAHLTLLECLLSISTSLPCDELLPVKINELKNQLPIQQQSLEKAIWQDEALRPAASKMVLSKCNLNKNRFPELASARIGRVYLKRYPPTDEDSDYISAVYVDGVKMQNQYIATQLPMPGTLGDFWRMVAEYKIELIVALQPPDPDDPTCCSIVPSSEFKPVPYINIKTKETITNDYYSLERLTLLDNMTKPPTEQQVTIATSTEWKPGKNQDPPSMIALVTLWQATEKIARGDGPTVVLCHDGVTGCGLYLALNVLLERMAVERECDVCLASRAVRRSNHGFVKSLEQMEYLYDAAITYLKYFETYANFT